jgi:hypothetical protein
MYADSNECLGSYGATVATIDRLWAMTAEAMLIAQARVDAREEAAAAL